MKSEDLKVTMLYHALFRQGCAGAVTEYCGKGCSGIADIFAVTKAGFSLEIEIKVNRQDLLGELNAIEYIKNSPIKKEAGLFAQHTPYTGSSNISKTSKHRSYLEYEDLGFSSEYKRAYVPNQFYFFVTQKLQAISEEKLKDTPYGLYVYNDRSGVECIKRASKLHKEKANQLLLLNILRKSSCEILYAREAQQKLRNELNSKK